MGPGKLPSHFLRSLLSTGAARAQFLLCYEPDRNRGPVTVAQALAAACLRVSRLRSWQARTGWRVAAILARHIAGYLWAGNHLCGQR